MSVSEALKLCGGAARTKLEGELRGIQGVRPDGPAGEPRVTYSLSAGTNPTPTQATYTYRVTAHTSDIGKTVVVLTLMNEGGHWLVTTLTEDQTPPAS
jgi:hypothetical protein